MIEDQAPGEGTPPAQSPSGHALLMPKAIPTRKNQLLAAGLAGAAVVILAIVVTLMLLIRYDNLPSLLSYFS